MKKYLRIISVVIALVMVLAIVAACSQTTYTVTYKDGDSTVYTQKVLEGEKAAKIAAPQKQDYNFVAWQLNDADYNFDTPVTSDITLSAKYAPNTPDDGLSESVRNVLNELVPNAEFAVKSATMLNNVKAIYTATKDGKVTNIIYLEKENTFIKPVKLYVAVDNDNKVAALKVTSDFHSANTSLKPGDLGIIGSNSSTLEANFDKVTGATVTSNTVKELALIALEQAAALNGGSQQPVDPDNPLVIDNGFQFNSKTGEIVDYVTSAKALLIPSEIRGVKVVTLGENLFKGDNTIETIIIPTSVTEIKFGAFQDCTKLQHVIFEQREAADPIAFGTNLFKGCTALEEITWPSNAKSLPSYVFEDCTSLTTVYNLDKVMNVGVGSFKGCQKLENVNLAGCYVIGSSAFENCASLANITIANTVNSIGEKAFANCSSLTEFNIPASLNTINLNVLEGCDKLAKITVDAASTKYTAKDNVLYTVNSAKDATSLYFVPSFVTTFELPATVTSIASTAFNSCDKLTAVTVESGSTKYAAVDGVLYQINASGIKTNLTYVPAKYQGQVTLFEGTSFIDTNALVNATGITKIVIEENNVNFVELDHVIYRKANATATTFTLVTANRDYEGIVTILDGNADYTLSTISAGAFANSKITGIRFTQSKHTNVSLNQTIFKNVNEGFKIYADASWKITLTGTAYSKWTQVADMIEWTTAE